LSYGHFVPAQSGRGGEIRTPDTLLPKQVRYQAALHPVGVASYAPVGKAVNAAGFGDQISCSRMEFLVSN
jgi:hypothetical protein